MEKFETVGYIGVDAGLLMLIDPCHVVSQNQWTDFYKEFAVKAKDEIGVAQLYGGIVVQTPHRDGLYPVEILRDQGGRIIEVRILFE